MTDDVIAQALADSKKKDDIGLGDNAIKNIAELVRKQIDLEDEIEKLEQLIKDKKQELDGVRDKTLPDLLLEYEIKKWETTDGHSVSISPMAFPSVKKEDMEKFAAWLKEKGDDGIIKPKLTFDFNKGEYDEAMEAIKLIKEKTGIEVHLEPDIHWSTFRAFAKEQIDNGTDMPDYYSVHSIYRSKIKRN